jgi:hypothetical protein
MDVGRGTSCSMIMVVPDGARGRPADRSLFRQRLAGLVGTFCCRSQFRSEIALKLEAMLLWRFLKVISY